MQSDIEFTNSFNSQDFSNSFNSQDFSSFTNSQDFTNSFNSQKSVKLQDVPKLQDSSTKKLSSKAWIIAGGVMFVVVLIGVSIGIYFATHKSAIVPPVTITPTNSHHFPINITPIAIKTNISIPLQLDGVTALINVLYIDDDVKTAGMMVSANHVVDNFITVDLSSQNLTYVRTLGVTQSYNNFNVRSGASYVVNSKQIETFVLKLSDATINNLQLLTAVPTTDTTKFNVDFYVVGDFKTNTIIVASFLIAQNLQSFDLISYQQDGTLLPKLTANIPIGSTYLKILASSQQVYFALLVIDQTQSVMYDVFYNNTTTDTKLFTIPEPPICACWVQNTTVLIICSLKSVFFYRRTISTTRSDYQLLDFITLTNVTIRNCAIDDTGTYFAICTNSKSIILGNIDGSVIASLTSIDANKEILNINNTNGPIGIQKNGGFLYIYQCDSNQDSALLQVSAF